MSASENEVDFKSAIISDNVQTELQIGTTVEGEPILWDLIQIEIHRSKITEPDFAKGIARPKEEYRQDVRNRVDELQDISGTTLGPGALIGDNFSVTVDTSLSVQESSEEDGSKVFTRTKAGGEGDESRVLFVGNVARLSPTGKESYQFTAYDPTQQALEIAGSDGKIDFANSGSIINKHLDFTGETPDLVSLTSKDEESGEDETNEPQEFSISAFKFIELLADDLPIPDEDITIRPFSKDFRQGDTRTISFENSQILFKNALDQLKEQFDIEWWVNREGEFYFGNPSELDGGIRVFELSLITDTTAGITTPPYQSVKVIGSSQQSGEESLEEANVSTAIQDDDNVIVKAVNIGLPQANAPIPVVSTTKGEDQQETLLDPTFTYINSALTTDAQAENAARSIAKDLIEQQAEGSITVTGLPEIDPFDGVRMPNDDKQPMGGRAYGVYGVRHKINSNDGFITEIEVSGPIFDEPNIVDVGKEETSVEPDEAETAGPDRTATAASSSATDSTSGTGEGNTLNDFFNDLQGANLGQEAGDALAADISGFIGGIVGGITQRSQRRTGRFSVERALAAGRENTRGIGEQSEGVSRSSDVFRDQESLDEAEELLERADEAGNENTRGIGEQNEGISQSADIFKDRSTLADTIGSAEEIAERSQRRTSRFSVENIVDEGQETTRGRGEQNEGVSRSSDVFRDRGNLDETREFSERANEAGNRITRGIGEQNDGISRSADFFRSLEGTPAPEAIDRSFEFLESVSPDPPEESVGPGRRDDDEDEDEE
jgi:hypothetical protein